MTMVERVARAIDDAQKEDLLKEIELAAVTEKEREHLMREFTFMSKPWNEKAVYDRDSIRNIARAAIAAMRDPTEAINAVEAMSINYGSDELWRMMIDAAIKETP